jgi:hypothetical protein
LAQPWDDDGVTEEDDADVDRAPICPYCGVTALPAEGWGEPAYVCENEECEAFGDRVDATGDE